MIEIKSYTDSNREKWDAYVLDHSHSNLYHLSGWKRVIENTYGHRTYYLIAIDSTQNSQSATRNPCRGILPLVHLKHFIFGNSLISMPYFDMGGILADDEATEQALLNEAIHIGQSLNVDTIEFRHINPLKWLADSNSTNSTNSINPINSTNTINTINPTNTTDSVSLFPCSLLPTSCSVVTKSHKVRMILGLPDSSEVLMKSFKSKLRSQIKKPIKEGLVARVGGLELLDNFYKVFAVNMRDLGSPVHSKKLIGNVLKEFADRSRIIVVYKENEPAACSLVVEFGEIMENPWASALRQYSRLSPNMLLYWTMLDHACNSDCGLFDFGRSSPDEGTYKFKKQWGSEPKPLNWQYLYLNGAPELSQPTDKSRFETAISYWQKLPVSVTKMIGPRIRKYIGL